MEDYSDEDMNEMEEEEVVEEEEDIEESPVKVTKIGAGKVRSNFKLHYLALFMLLQVLTAVCLSPPKRKKTEKGEDEG